MRLGFEREPQRQLSSSVTKRHSGTEYRVRMCDHDIVTTPYGLDHHFQSQQKQVKGGSSCQYLPRTLFTISLRKSPRFADQGTEGS